MAEHSKARSKVCQANVPSNRLYGQMGGGKHQILNFDILSERASKYGQVAKTLMSIQPCLSNLVLMLPFACNYSVNLNFDSDISGFKDQININNWLFAVWEYLGWGKGWF